MTTLQGEEEGGGSSTPCAGIICPSLTGVVKRGTGHMCRTRLITSSMKMSSHISLQQAGDPIGWSYSSIAHELERIEISVFCLKDGSPPYWIVLKTLPL